MREIFRGDNQPYTLSFLQADGITPLPITGWKIYFTMKRHLADSDDDASLKVDVTEHDDPENGLTSIHLSNGQTDSLKPGNYFYDIQVKKLDGTIKTLVAGQIKVLADVTRRED